MNKKMLGVTLIELMIVVAIVGILASVAYPSYQGYLEAGRRETAREFIVLDVLKAQAKYLNENNRYSNSFQVLGYGNGAKFQDDYYEYEISYPGNVNSRFVIKATPINNYSDKTCGYLEFEMPGYKTRSEKANADRCWQVEF